MPEVELDLLERALHQKRRIAVHHRPHPGQRQATGHPDQALFPDADIDHAPGMTLACLVERRRGNDRRYHRESRVGVQRLADRVHERLPHPAVDPRHGLVGLVHACSSLIVATTASGRPECSVVKAR